MGTETVRPENCCCATECLIICKQTPQLSSEKFSEFDSVNNIYFGGKRMLQTRIYIFEDKIFGGFFFFFIVSQNYRIDTLLTFLWNSGMSNTLKIREINRASVFPNNLSKIYLINVKMYFSIVNSTLPRSCSQLTMTIELSRYTPSNSLPLSKKLFATTLLR